MGPRAQGKLGTRAVRRDGPVRFAGSASRCALRLFAAALLSGGASGCDPSPTPVLAIDAAPPPPPAPPVREGCARTGALESIETEPSCVVTRVPDEAMRSAMRSLAISLTAEPTEAFAGGSVRLELVVRNTSAAEVTLFFEARPRPAGPRTDWSRVIGIPDPHTNGAEVPRLLFPITTTDSHDRDVDAVPTVAGSAPIPPAPTLLAVHLRPGGKLVHVMSWWALRIPAPAPIFKDDAGHRFVPKTMAVNLYPSEYTVTLELPFHGLGREERKTSTRIQVTRTPLLDGGVRKTLY